MNQCLHFLIFEFDNIKIFWYNKIKRDEGVIYMAKVSFNKLGLSKNTNIKNFEYNGQNIEVKQYLPINDKATLVAQILSCVLNNDENRFANPLQIEVFTLLGVIEKYTNITFTEKQKEDPAKLYDLIISSNLWNKVLDNLDGDDYESLLNYIHEAIDAYYKYHNSVFGILDSINKDYSDMNLDATEIQKKLADPENMALLRDVLAKLG